MTEEEQKGRGAKPSTGEKPNPDATQVRNKGRHGKGRYNHDRESKSKGFVPGNDFTWWNKVSELMKDAVNLKVNSIAGTPVFGKASVNTAIIPGAMRILMQNTYGSEVANTDPINLQFRDLFLRMFQKYRGISSYQYSDLTIVELCAIEIFSMVAKLERIYGVINYYDKLNVNIPRTVLEAIGINPVAADIIRTRLSDYRYDLNYLIRKASRICVPKDMSVLADRISLYGYLYKDHDARRAQIYAFDCTDFGIFDETTLTTGSAMHYKFCNSVVTSGAIVGNPMIQLVDDQVNMFYALDRMISALIGSDSANKIFADLTVWFGEDSMITMLPLPDDYVILPVYSESILHKIHNADILATDDQDGTAATATPTLLSLIDSSLATADQNALSGILDRWIYQTPNGTVVTAFVLTDDTGQSIGNCTYRGKNYKGKVIRDPTNFSLCGLKEYGRVLDSYHEDFTDEVVCEGSLWKTVPSLVEAGDKSNMIIMSSCSFEIIVQAQVCQLTNNGGMQSFSVTPLNMSQAAARFAAFDWAPLLYEESLNYTPTRTINEIYGEIDTYRSISANELSKIHTAALLSGVYTGVTVVNK